MQPTQLLAVKRLSMTKTDSQTETHAGLVPADVPFLGWSRAALEFRRKVAEMAPGGFFRPLIVGDPGVGKRTMARAWLHVSGKSAEERPIVNLDTQGDELPERCIAFTTRRPPPGRPYFQLHTGTWDETDGSVPAPGTLPADLMQRFAITMYMPPIHRHREIDALAFLHYCCWVRIRSAGVIYRRIDAGLIHHILFKNDWPANLEGLSRALKHLAYSDWRDARMADQGGVGATRSNS
jgi:transcriptional regulator with AAA-type ATPase domain